MATYVITALAIPEPSSWEMVFSDMGLLVATLRLRCVANKGGEDENRSKTQREDAETRAIKVSQLHPYPARA